jgi:hypothetical protein
MKENSPDNAIYLNTEAAKSTMNYQNKGKYKLFLYIKQGITRFIKNLLMIIRINLFHMINRLGGSRCLGKKSRLFR